MDLVFGVYRITRHWTAGEPCTHRKPPKLLAKPSLSSLIWDKRPRSSVAHASVYEPQDNYVWFPERGLLVNVYSRLWCPGTATHWKGAGWAIMLKLLMMSHRLPKGL